MENALTVHEGGYQSAVVNFEEYAMDTKGVLNQIRIVHEVLEGVMKVDEHYGTIPGTKKPSLYKAGAEKLSLTFRLRPEYEIRRSDLGNGHREYEVVCTLYHIPTGQSVGQGVGSATTMEGKYRYRGGEKEGTGRPLPKEYWNKRGTDPKGAEALIGGPGFSAGKIDGNWEICSTGEKMEHDNPADYYNTVLKMAKKRAHVDAILTATAASDIFTQDVEDMPEVIPGAKEDEKKTADKPPLKPPEKKAPPAGAPLTGIISDISTAQGETKGKPWTRYDLTIDGGKYSTFSDTFADIARTAKKSGASVTFTFTAGERGNTIKTLEVAESRDPGAEG